MASVSAHTPPSSFPQSKGLMVPSHSKVADSLREYLKHGHIKIKIFGLIKVVNKYKEITKNGNYNTQILEVDLAKIIS